MSKSPFTDDPFKDSFVVAKLPCGTLSLWKTHFAKGTFATVHAGDVTYNHKCVHVAVKVQRWMHEQFWFEVRLQSRLARMTRNLKDAARVLPVYGCCTLFKCPAAVMPLAHGSVYELLGNTRSQIRRGKLVNHVVRQVARLLEVLQARCTFMHRDLHCSNVLYRVEGNPASAPIAQFHFFLSDFGNAVCCRETTAERQDATVLNGLQRQRQFSTTFNPGLDLNTLITSTREFLSENMLEISTPLREAIQYFLAKASRSRSYTPDGQEMLKQSLFFNGKNIGRAPCNPLIGENVPLFWFSYAGAAGLALNKTVPAALCGWGGVVKE